MKLLCLSDKYTINVDTPYKDITVPDIITVVVETEDGAKEVVVEVLNLAINKPNLGGYKHIKTGVKYLHGYSQTGPPPPKVPPEMKNHRDTQTYLMRNRKLDMEYSRATQMASKDIYIPSVNDRILTAGPYETADEREARLNVEGKVKTIQRYFRAWKMRKALHELSDEYQRVVRLEQERLEAERLEDEARKRRDLVSKVFPMTLTDFAMLYSMVEKWKKAEMARISSMYCGPSKIAEFYLLLEKEVEILRSLEKLKLQVIEDLGHKKVIKFFKAIGKPIEWYSNYKSLHIYMDTLETQRGREYFTLYKSLVNKDLTTDQRLQVYCEIKTYLADHDCGESLQIIHLIDRVCQLMARGTSHRHLDALEKRIDATVLHHFKLPECNEGVTKHMHTVKMKKMKKGLAYCPRCQRFKTIDRFKLNGRTNKVKICSSCKWLDKAEEPWIDLLPYRFMLRQIRNYERLHHAASSVAFILQDKDIYHIVTNIWHSHSALSENNDVYQLRLVRWDVTKEWSPWNCILLTVEEASVHLRVRNLQDVYEEEFLKHIFNKHALARKHFPLLKAYDRHFTEMVRGDMRLDEESEYYNKPEPDCLFDLALSSTESSKNSSKCSQCSSDFNKSQSNVSDDLSEKQCEKCIYK
nr:unnamed protein product [Callosobruchus chinensis]